MIRIQTGSDKGRELKKPPTPTIRPSTNKVREAIVDILRSKNKILNARILDLFAGTGAVGFELLSNGAREVVFVEKTKTGVEIIKENARKTKKLERIKIIKEDVLRALEVLVVNGEKFDIIFADPPYNIDDEYLENLEQKIPEVLADEGIFILEHSSKRTFVPKRLNLLTTKKYGDTNLTFYGKVAD
jgi:16S rRNA (guanine(966)-N(2))-methyltransferase RsmD